MPGQTNEEFLQRGSFPAIFRHKIFHPNVTDLQRYSCFARENERFARHVHAVEVIARIGLGIALLFGFHDNLTKSFALGEAAEYKIQRTTQHGLDPDNFIPAE